MDVAARLLTVVLWDPVRDPPHLLGRSESRFLTLLEVTGKSAKPKLPPCQTQAFSGEPNPVGGSLGLAHDGSCDGEYEPTSAVLPHYGKYYLDFTVKGTWVAPQSRQARASTLAWLVRSMVPLAGTSMTLRWCAPKSHKIYFHCLRGRRGARGHRAVRPCDASRGTSSTCSLATRMVCTVRMTSVELSCAREVHSSNIPRQHGALAPPTAHMSTHD